MDRKAIWVLGFLLLGSRTLLPQSTTGGLEGWVITGDNQPVVAANVVVTSPDLLGVRGSVTDEKGHFLVPALPIGVYAVRIGHLSFEQAVRYRVAVHLGRTTDLGQVRLSPRTIQAEEIVTRADREATDDQSMANGFNLLSSSFAAYALERSYLRMAELLPEVNQSYKRDGTNFAGATGIENKYFIDGAEVTDPLVGLPGINLPYNFVKEVEVRTGGYQAEYQSSLGGVVNAVTYSGGNEVHGQVFGFFTNNDFSRPPRLASGSPPQGRYAEYDVGFSLGGPILRDQLWYFIAYDPHIVSEDVPILGLGAQNSRSTAHMLAGKLSWKPDDQNQIALAVCGDPTVGRAVSTLTSGQGLSTLNPEACGYNYSNSRFSAIANGSHLLQSNLLLESSLSVLINRYATQNESPWANAMSVWDFVAGTASGGTGVSNFEVIRRVTGGVKARVALPGHALKAGVQYEENSLEMDDANNALQFDGNAYWSWDSRTRGTVRQRNPSVFLQDSWQLSRQFCLNLGVRWDPQWLIASDGSVAQTITDQVQPRAGIAYQPGQSGQEKITASFGRYYQALQLSLSSVYHVRGAYQYVGKYPNDPRVDTAGGGRFNLCPFIENVPDVKGQYFDEFCVGYERQLSADFLVRVGGVFRRLGQGIEDGVTDPRDQTRYGSLQVYGNPGSGPLAALPRMKRQYAALDIVLQRSAPGGPNLLASYTLSRNAGNWDGLAETYDLPGAGLSPNVTNQLALPERMINAYGLLPNDRTHVFKLLGSWAFDIGLSTGWSFQWMTGTPLNVLGVDPVYEASTFLQQRGSAGRTPAIWDLNIRLSYDLSHAIPMQWSGRLIFDLLHVAGRRSITDIDQYLYAFYGVRNSHYLVPVQFQPPMAARLGFEVNY